MKHKLINFLLTGFAGLLVCNVTLAQADTMKTLPAVTVHSTTNVEKKVTEAFQRDFKDAVSPEWYKINKNYLVTFISSDLENRALYKKGGNLVYHISYGTEQNLPEDVRKQIKEVYNDYNITRAINVHQEGRNIWVVNLEGLKRMILVRVEDGELEEVQNFEKST